jgi:hypothetical protein
MPDPRPRYRVRKKINVDRNVAGRAEQTRPIVKQW